MKFAAGTVTAALLGVSLLAGSSASAQVGGTTTQDNGTLAFLKRAADLRTPAAPEPLGGQFGGPVGEVGEATGLYTIALRLGAAVAPRTRFVGGIDVTLPRLSLGANWSTRIDAEAIVSANFGGVSTLIPLTFNQIYSKGLVSGTRLYGGVGIGPYFGEITRFGGKLIFGAGLSQKIGLELNLHFPGFDDPYLTILARLPFSF
jgi:hypothetical protein